MVLVTSSSKWLTVERQLFIESQGYKNFSIGNVLKVIQLQAAYLFILGKYFLFPTTTNINLQFREQLLIGLQ